MTLSTRALFQQNIYDFICDCNGAGSPGGEDQKGHQRPPCLAATHGASHHVPVGLGIFFATAPTTQAVVKVNATKETQLWQGSSGGHAAKWPLASSACEAWTPTFT